MERKVKLPIGIENFAEIRTQGFYYVDKTALITELLHNWGKVNLFTRPRRFGKSLNLSMLQCFFEIGCNPTLFDGLSVSKEQDLCEAYMGQFPVISVSLKGVNGNEFEQARAMLCNIIAQEAMRFQFLLESDKLTESEKLQYKSLIARDEKGLTMTSATLMNSLRTLSILLEKHYDHKVIILIDEYDVPLDKAMQAGFYSDMIVLIRNLLSEALKTNSSLHFAVLTGCLRVSKESIFTGLNNLNVYSITNIRFDEYFGFTDDDVSKILQYYQLSDKYDVVKAWYDGYRFGNEDVYCPWDVICYCDQLLEDKEAIPEAFWSTTSSNDIIRRFIDMADATTKEEIEKLMAGETIVKSIHKELTYKDLYDSPNNLWSVLYLTGYLTQRGRVDNDRLLLAIPNQEIHKIFATQIKNWFQDTAREDGATLNAFCEAFKNGDAAKVQQQFRAYLKKTISIRDTFVKKEMKENFYHGILIGLLGYKTSWKISSSQQPPLQVVV